MADEKDKLVTKVNEPAGLSNEQLLKMLIETQKAQAEAQRELAAALLEARKPYVDPKVLEEKQRALEEKRQAVNLELRNRIARKAGCPHIRDNGTPNIKWMEHSNGITTGAIPTIFSFFDGT
jgi:hypothetical protein